MMEPLNKNALPKPETIRPDAAEYQGPYGFNLRYPGSVLATALGCSIREQTLLQTKLFDLCRQCIIRFGIPSDAPYTLAQALEIPASAKLRHGHYDQMDPRWGSLARSLELPQPRALHREISMRVCSQTQLEEILSGVATLSKELAESRLTAIDPNIALTLRQKTHELQEALIHRGQGIAPDHALLRGAVRQLKIANELNGAQWTLLLPDEHKALSEFAGKLLRPSQIDRTNREIPPSDSLLIPFTMVWQWREGRGWEPRLPTTRNLNASLFDLSSIYLHKEVQKHISGALPRTPAGIALLRALDVARSDFEKRRGSIRGSHVQPDIERGAIEKLERSLHQLQNRKLNDLLDRFSSMQAP